MRTRDTAAIRLGVIALGAMALLTGVMCSTTGPVSESPLEATVPRDPERPVGPVVAGDAGDAGDRAEHPPAPAPVADVRWIDLEVRAVEGLTGRPIAVPEVRWVEPGDDVMILEPAGAVHRGGRVLHEGRRPLILRVTPPAGFATVRRDLLHWERVSDMAATLSATVVVWPAMTVRVIVVDGDGRPVPGATVLLTRGRGCLCQTELVRSGVTDEAGTSVLRRLARVPGDLLDLAAIRGDARAVAEIESDRAGDLEIVRLALPGSVDATPPGDDRWESLASSREEPESGGRPFRRPMTPRTRPLPTAPAGREVTVTVVDAAGRPVPGARVDAGVPVVEGATQRIGIRTDDRGAVVLRGLPEAALVVRARLVGRWGLARVPADTDRARLVLEPRMPFEDMPDIRGRVTDVSGPDGVITISVGAEDEVRKGYTFTVYRGSEYVGKLVIIGVEERRAFGTMDEGVTREAPRVDDEVATQL